MPAALAPADEYYTSQRDAAVKIRFFDRKSTEDQVPITVMEYVEELCQKYQDRVAMKVEREGKWVEWNYAEYLRDIKIVGKALIKLGLEPYHGVGIMGFNAPEWLLSDLGAIFAGGFATGIYSTNNAKTCQYVCADAGCNIMVVENDIQLQKMLEIWDNLPELKAIVQYTGEVKDKKPNIYNWNEFMEIGKGEPDAVLEQRIAEQAPNKCCMLIYTSGTTGNPKGVMVSHDNIIMALRQLIPKLASPVDGFEDRCVSYLPLSHIAAQTTDIYGPISLGGSIWFAKPDALKGTLVETLKAARPTLFLGVPRVYEKIEEKLKGIGLTVTGIRKKISTWAKGVALQGNQNIEKGLAVPWGWTIATSLLRKAHVGLGLDQARLLFTGAAPFSQTTCEYFQSLNLPIYEAYGMSEMTGLTSLCLPGNYRTSSIGTLLDLTDYKVLDADKDGNGELCFKGRTTCMGYINNIEKTKELIDEDGWLHSGDVGKIDKDGYFYLTGRIKEIIITAGGENIAPVPIEDRIKTELPLIATAMVIGDQKKFLSCLLTLQVEIDQENGLPTNKLLPMAKEFCSKLGLDVTSSQEIAPDVPEKLKDAIQKGIDAINKEAISNAAKVQKWKLLPLDFTTASGELGPTQKLRRPIVAEMYKDLIAEFYTDFI